MATGESTPTQGPGTDVRSQDRVGDHAPVGLALHQSNTNRPVWAAHEGHVRVAEPSRGWASDITGIRTWGGRNGRLAIMIDCEDRIVLPGASARGSRPRIWPRCCGKLYSGGLGRHEPKCAGDRVFQRQRARIHVASVQAVRASHGAHPCHTSRRNPQSNGLAEAVFGCLNRIMCIRRASRYWKR
jgi:transposase InsO family protein